MDKTSPFVVAAVVILFTSASFINGLQFDCAGKPDGNYPDPVDQCSGYFYICSNGEASYMVCAQAGTVFDPTLDRCEFCQLVYPCNADPDNIRCATLFTSESPTRPTCPPYDPNVYNCVCSATSCQLELITTTARPAPTCPPFDPSVYVCVCNALTCQLELITTTAPPKPTCPPYDPSVYVCVCSNISCQLQLITTTTPICPPYDPSIYICVCSATSCELILITTTARPAPTCPPFDPSVYVCVCGALSCSLELITTTARPAPTCPPFDPSVFICVCGPSTCNLELITTTAPTRPVTDVCPGTTRKTTVSTFVYDCTGKPDGDYPDPFDPCSGYFWTCTNGEAFYEKCALQGTVFDPIKDVCDYCANVFPCNVFF